MRSLVFALMASCIASGSAVAQKACPPLAGTGQPGQLYLKPGDGGPWINASALPGTVTLGHKVSAVYVVDNDRGGVIAVKQRNEAPAFSSARDVQTVQIDRPAVQEACTIGGRRKPLQKLVSAQEYAEYHSNAYKESVVLRAFHFPYQPSAEETCRRTDRSGADGRVHFLFGGASGPLEPQYRAAAIDETRLPALLKLVTNAVSATFGLGVAQARTEAARTEAGPRYLLLRTTLRRYRPAAPGTLNCVPFDFYAAENVAVTYLTVVDLDEGDGGYPSQQRTWALKWVR